MADPHPDRSKPPLQSQSRARLTAILAVGFFCLLLIVPALIYLGRAGRVNSAPASSEAVSGDLPVVKIAVSEAGIYRLTLGDLRQAGWTADLESAQNIRLSSQGYDQPFTIDRSSGTPALLFYGQPAAGLYSSENAYILQDLDFPDSQVGVEDWTGTPPEKPAAAPADLPDESYFAVQRVEENRLYLPQADGEERWFWLPLTAPLTQTVELNLQDLSNANNNGQELARLTLSLYSSTEAPASPDHQLRILVNDRPAAENGWDGKGTHQIEVSFDHQLLVEGVNRVTLVAPGIPEVAADISHLDWLEVGYPRQLRARDDRLGFWSAGGETRLSKFTGAVYVFDVTDPWGAVHIGALEMDGGTATLQSQPGHHYLAVGPRGFLKPERISPLVSQPDLRRLQGGADYIAIGPDALLAELEPLLKYRAEQGLSTAAVPVQAVYDQFGHGLSSPQSIQDFLRYVSENWDTAPRYLLLVGDASYDPKGYQSPPQANQIVAPMVDTIFGGQTTSDVPLVQLNDDQWPDLAVGLVPARTPDQVHAFVEKTLDYENSLHSLAKPGGVLAVADGYEPSFRWDAEAFLDLFDPGTLTDLIAPAPGGTGTTSQIEEKLSSGVSLLAYFGHGSLTMWGKDKLFTAEEAVRLRNSDHLPVILNMTCLTGLYTHPEVDSLAESLLFNKHGGAAAVLAPSSLTLAADQSFLSRPLIEEMLKDPQAALGDVHLRARRRISLDSAGTRDVMMTFMLFGDPALSLPPLSPSP